MVVRRADNVALRGACVYHDLLPVPFLFEYVEYLREHLHSGADRYGYHSDVAPTDALLERDDLVHKFHPFGRGGVHRVSLHPKNYPGESSSLQVDGHRAAYQAQTNDSYYHIIVALMSLRQARRPNISVTESSVAELAIAEPVAELAGC